MRQLLLCLAVLLASNGQALAHGGDLDAHGGHHNHNEGNYHFHRGPLSGQTFASKADAMDALNKNAARTSNDRHTQEKQPERGQTRQ